MRQHSEHTRENMPQAACGEVWLTCFGRAVNICDWEEVRELENKAFDESR